MRVKAQILEAVGEKLPPQKLTLMGVFHMLLAAAPPERAFPLKEVHPVDEAVLVSVVVRTPETEQILVFVDENAVLVEAELPGKTAADVELTIEPQTLVLTDKPAKKDGETDAPKPAYERRIELPFRVDADKANAAFKDGVLKIELPKADPSAPRRIAIATA